jgi:hypothetical protein
MQALPACLGTFRTLRTSRYRFGSVSFSNKGFCTEYPPVSASFRPAGRRKPANQAFADALDIVGKSDALENARGFRPFRYFRQSVAMPGERANDGTCCDPPGGMEGRRYALF